MHCVCPPFFPSKLAKDLNFNTQLTNCMLEVKVMRAEDFSFAVQLANTMNWNMTEEDFKFSLTLEPKGCFVAWQDNVRLGLITSISFGELGWFGNLIVKPDARRKGAAHALISRTLQFLQKKGAKTIGIYAYPNLQGFYENLGFKPDAEFAVLHNDKVACKEKNDVSIATLKDLQTLNSFDTKCFGADRKKLLKTIMSEPKNSVFYQKENGEPVGFVVAKIFGKIAEVGPLVCMPERVDIAQKLLLATLSRLNGFYVSLYVPVKEKILYEMLIGLGFMDDFRLIRMFYGTTKSVNCVYMAESLERG
jgi:GNAT superfamily N-acetyltransferase